MRPVKTRNSAAIISDPNRPLRVFIRTRCCASKGSIGSQPLDSSTRLTRDAHRCAVPGIAVTIPEHVKYLLGLYAQLIGEFRMGQNLRVGDLYKPFVGYD